MDHLPNLRPIRQDLGLTMEQLAEIVGCSLDTIRRAEGAISGKYRYGITLHNATLIADKMGMGLDMLAGRIRPEQALQSYNETKQFLMNYRRK